MPETTKITETGRRGIESVNPKLFGQYDSIVALLRRRLGPDHAFLLAEPVPLGTSAKEGRDIAWFVPGTCTAQPLRDLGDESRQVRMKLTRLTDDIRNLATRLDDEGGASREISRFLRDALVFPDDSRIWSVDGRPVLVDWGYRKVTESSLGRDVRSLVLGTGGYDENEGDDPSRPEQNSFRSSARAANTTGNGEHTVPEPTPIHAKRPFSPGAWPPIVQTYWRPPNRRAVFLWLLFTAVLVIIGDLLLQACAISTPSWARFLSSWGFNRCPADRLNAETASIHQIESDIRAQEALLFRRMAACRSSCPVPTAPAGAGGLTSDPVPSPSSSPGSSLPPAPMPPPPLPADVKRGKIELTLVWEGGADLDLFVICPDGGEISYRRLLGCGGQLVADLNRGGGQPSSKPIEHIIWNDEPMPDGTYSVRVSLYKRHIETRPDIPYQVYLRLNNAVQRSAEGRASEEGKAQDVLTFQAPMGR
jgi:hypothetical protein